MVFDKEKQQMMYDGKNQLAFGKIPEPEQAEPETAAVLQETAPAIGPNEIKKFINVLRDYKTGKAATDRRIIASEQWWKLRNTEEEQKETEVGKDGGFTSRSGWLHNVIVSKHADAMEAYQAAAAAAGRGHQDCQPDRHL